jgi:hypothetical protein
MTHDLTDEQVSTLRLLSEASVTVSWAKRNGKARLFAGLTTMGLARLFPGAHDPNWRITKAGRAVLRALTQKPVQLEMVMSVPDEIEAVVDTPQHELIDVVLLSLDDMSRHISLLQQAVHKLRPGQTI